MMSNTIRSTVGLLLMIGANVANGQTAASATVDRSKEEAALRETDLAWSAAASRKDLDATVSYMADDGETLAPNEPIARDKAAVRASWKNLLGLPNAAVAWKPLRVQVAESGEIGFTSGTYTLSWTGEDGKPVNDNGKYLEVWRKVDGKWRCVSDAYNSDMPLP
jgi:ketosteroid isomerase-like protein